MKPHKFPLWIVFLGLLFTFTITAAAQQDCTGSERIPHALDSGMISNPTQETSIVFESMITVENATWIRLYFADADLPPGSYIRMTAMLDGEMQELDDNYLAMWDHSSAYFNGDAVRLELIAAPGTSGSRISVDQVAVHVVPDGQTGPCYYHELGICEIDDRIPSDELWTARLMPVCCTASIYNTASCAVTAGHCCYYGWDEVLEFNVPFSLPNCLVVHPPVADQFPVTGHVWDANPDWAVLTVGTNHLGETPYERYGVYRPIADTPAYPSDFVELWGYGMDNSEPVRSQVQQYSAGAIVNLIPDYYRHSADIMFGSSGGAVLHNDEIVAIQSAGSPDCQNWATRVDIPEFVTARDTLCPAATAIEPLTAPVHLLQSNPNPFSTSTHVGFNLPRSAQVRLHIFDASGALMTTLADGPLAAGPHQIAWDGRNDAGRLMASGVYVCQLCAEGRTETRAMLLLR